MKTLTEFGRYSCFCSCQKSCVRSVVICTSIIWKLLLEFESNRGSCFCYCKKFTGQIFNPVYCVVSVWVPCHVMYPVSYNILCPIFWDVEGSWAFVLVESSEKFVRLHCRVHGQLYRCSCQKVISLILYPVSCASYVLYFISYILYPISYILYPVSLYPSSKVLKVGSWAFGWVASEASSFD